MFGPIEKVFIRFLSFSKSLCRIVNTPDHGKCTSFNNKQCMTQPGINNLHPNE